MLSWTVKIHEWQTEEDGVLMSSVILKMKKKFEMYCVQILVLGFNSSRYDINLLKNTYTCIKLRA